MAYIFLPAVRIVVWNLVTERLRMINTQSNFMFTLAHFLNIISSHSYNASVFFFVCL
jgi:hypothetical protein